MSDYKNKHRFPLYINEDVLASVKSMYREYGYSSQSEFIEKAVEFYLGYLKMDMDMDLIAPVVMSTIRSVVTENTTRITRLLFKNSVEMALMNNILAYEYQIDPENVKKVREECEKTVRKTNGNFSIEDAVKWQKG